MVKGEILFFLQCLSYNTGTIKNSDNEVLKFKIAERWSWKRKMARDRVRKRSLPKYGSV